MKTLLLFLTTVNLLAQTLTPVPLNSFQTIDDDVTMDDLIPVYDWDALANPKTRKASAKQFFKGVYVNTIQELVDIKPVYNGQPVSLVGHIQEGDFWLTNNVTLTNTGNKIALSTPGWSAVRNYSGSINVRHFGAKGAATWGWVRDQVGEPVPEDSQPYLQSVIDCAIANKKEIDIPHGIYRLASPLVINAPTGVHIRGQHIDDRTLVQYTDGTWTNYMSTVLVRDFDGPLLLVRGNLDVSEVPQYREQKNWNGIIEDIQLRDKTGNETTNSLVVIKRAVKWEWKRVQFQSVSTALEIFTGDDSTFEGCRFEFSGTYDRAPAVKAYRSITLPGEDTYTANNVLRFWRCIWEGNYGQNFNVPTNGTGNASGLSFIGCNFKLQSYPDAPVANVEFNNVTSLDFFGCTFSTKGGTITAAASLNEIAYFYNCRQVFGVMPMQYTQNNTNLTLYRFATFDTCYDVDLGIFAYSVLGGNITDTYAVLGTNTLQNVFIRGAINGLTGKQFSNIPTRYDGQTIIGDSTVAATAGYRAHSIFRTDDASDTTRAHVIERQYSGSGAQGITVAGATINRLAGDGGVTRVIGHDMTASFDQPVGNTATSVYGAQVTPRSTAGGQVNTMASIISTPTASGNSTVTDNYGFWAFSPTVSAGSTVANAYGVYISSQKAANVTTGWGVYQAATTDMNYFGSPIRMTEVSAPSVPAANGGILFLRDNGAGKTQLAIQFNSGAVQVIATEP